MKLLVVVGVLLNVGSAISVVAPPIFQCERGYRKTNLFYGERPLRNYLVAAEPDKNPEDALKRIGGAESAMYSGNKGKDASYSITVKGYRADVDASSLCLETKCVKTISVGLESAYSPLETRRDEKGRLHLVSDIGTSVGMLQGRDIEDPSDWTTTCYSDIGRVSKLSLSLEADSGCRPMIRNLFMKACKKKKLGPVYCLDPYSTRLYRAGRTWDVTEFVEGSCAASCTCDKDGSQSCISSACPMDTCYHKGKTYTKGDTWRMKGLGKGCRGTCECKGTADVQCQAVC